MSSSYPIIDIKTTYSFVNGSLNVKDIVPLKAVALCANCSERKNVFIPSIELNLKNLNRIYSISSKSCWNCKNGQARYPSFEEFILLNVYNKKYENKKELSNIIDNYINNVLKIDILKQEKENGYDYIKTRIIDCKLEPPALIEEERLKYQYSTDTPCNGWERAYSLSPITTDKIEPEKQQFVRDGYQLDVTLSN